MLIRLLPSLVVFGLILVLVLSYTIRVMIRGRAQYARVDRQGGSLLLSKHLMEMVYWGIQPVGSFLIRMKIHPDHLTWTSLLFGIGAGLSVARGWFGIGAILGGISAILDALDGFVARARGITSRSGEVLDSAIDRYTEFAFLGGLAFYYRHSIPLLLLCLLAIHGSYMVSYSSAKAEILGLKVKFNIMRRPERAAYLLIGAALSPLFYQLIEASGGQPHAYPMIVGLTLVAVMANISAFLRLRYLLEASRRSQATPSKVASVAALRPLRPIRTK